MSSTSPPYRLAEAPGKNHGLFATRPIATGELIISEAPLFTAQGLFEVGPAVQRLSAAEKAAFEALTDAYCPDKPTPVTRFKTNALPLGVGSTRGGLFPQISRINHSCRPNVHHSWCEKLGKEVIYASSPIAQGQEILTTYLEPYASTEERRRILVTDFRFICRCDVCERAEPANDALRKKIARLGDEILYTSRRDPIGGLRLAKERLRLMEEEGSGDPAEYSVTHYDAYQTCIAVSDLEAAKRHMGLTYAYRLLSEGPDSSEIPRNLSLYRSPGSHPATGMHGRRTMPGICDGCGKEAVGVGGKKEKGASKLLVCEDCKCTVYCDEECQAKHRAWHEAACSVAGRLR